MSICTVISYHYVRKVFETRFPRIKALNLSSFREQIAYMKRFYIFVTAQDCIDAIYTKKKLPRNAALLTFDDGYSDHYMNVFPILDDAGIQGCFFLPVSAVRDGRVLDVNKIHFILASVKNIDQLQLDIFDILNRLRSEGYTIASNDDLYQKLAIDGKCAEYLSFDSSQVVFIKQLLQRELTQDIRSSIIDELFKRYVTNNELAFARELYLSEDQIHTMVRHGMIVGNHGYEHRWMNTLSAIEQKKEVESSNEFLQKFGMNLDNWLMCYPYGAYDASLQSICTENGCSLAFTTEVGIAELKKENALTLPRLDTIHLPVHANEKPNSWTQRVLDLAY
jgi:peptidoglycan/xylan/chitin deacetylase (PgdA/CDA1 family)